MYTQRENKQNRPDEMLHLLDRIGFYRQLLLRLPLPILTWMECLEQYYSHIGNWDKCIQYVKFFYYLFLPLYILIFWIEQRIFPILARKRCRALIGMVWIRPKSLIGWPLRTHTHTLSLPCISFVINSNHSTIKIIISLSIF